MAEVATAANCKPFRQLRDPSVTEIEILAHPQTGGQVSNRRTAKLERPFDLPQRLRYAGDFRVLKVKALADMDSFRQGTDQRVLETQCPFHDQTVRQLRYRGAAEKQAAFNVQPLR